VKRVLALCVAAVLLVAVGCGSGAATSVPDPATLAPTRALAFANFEIAPQGPERAGFDAAFGKLFGPAPATQLGAAFTHAAQTSGSLDYVADVKPWLGDTLSLVVTRAAPHICDFVLLAASTDDDKAQAAIDKDLTGVHAHARDYRGVSYRVQDDGTVNSVFSHYLIAGTEPAFKAVVDAVKDGQSLADSDQWKTTVGDRGQGKVGLAYVDVKGVLQSVASSLPGAQGLAAPLLLGLVQIHPFVATLDAQPDALVVDVSSPGTKPDPRGPAAASSPLIEALPADAWLAAAAPKVGDALSKVADALKSNPLIAAQYEQIVTRVRERTGLDLQHDLLSIGDVALFARGTTPTSARGTLVVKSGSSATVPKLRALIEPRTHQRLRVRAGVAPPRTLGDTALFKKAATAVGGRPALFVNFGPALDLAAASPHHKADEHFQQALPRLRHIEFVAAGARREGGLDVLRGVVGLR
jgi:hypothetical protein